MAIEVSAQLGGRMPPAPDPRPHFDISRRAVERTLRAAGVRDAYLSLTFLDDPAIAELNSAHLGHEGPTDVLSFRLDGPDGDLAGDVYVGYQEAARAASEEAIRWEEELVRLSVHGVLHVLGHEHPDGPERVGSEMWRAQEALVAETLRAAAAPREGAGGAAPAPARGRGASR